MKTILKFKNIKRADFDNLSPELKNAKDIRYLIIEPNGTFTESIAGQTINTGSSGGGDGGYQPDNTTIVLNEEEKLSVKPAIITQVNNNTNSINGKLDKKPDGTVDLITANNKIDARYLDIDSDLFIVVASLPSTGVANKIYLVPNSDGAGSNVYDEYIWLSNKWEQFGTITVDLSNYYNKTETNTLLNGKADKNHNHDDKYANINHNHDDTYYTKTENDTLLDLKASLDYVNDELGKKIDKTEVIKDTVHITYADLVALKNSNGLNAGTTYRIIDYATDPSNSEVFNHYFDVLVVASGTNTLFEEATVMERAGETYFADNNCKLHEWRVWYTTETKGVNPKGTITRMIDEHGNDLPYDFKNMKVRRYKITGIKLPAFVDRLSYLIGTYSGGDSLLFSYDNNDYKEYYTFSFESSDGTITDSSLKGNSKDNKFYGSQVRGNLFLGTATGNVFYGTVVNNTFLDYCSGNSSVSSTIQDNIFGSGCGGNEFDSVEFRSNFITNNFQYNKLKNGTWSFNVIKNGFKGNTIEDGAYANVIGSNFQNNKTKRLDSCIFGDNCVYNTLNMKVELAIFPHRFKYSTIEKEILHIKFDFTQGTTDEIRYLHIKHQIKGIDGPTPTIVDLYFTGLENRNYLTTYDVASNNNILATWQSDYEKRLGKYLTDNTDTTWKDIPDTLGDIESALDAILGV